MTGIMTFHIRRKYAAACAFLCAQAGLKALRPYSKTGRKEILMFYLYAIIELLGIFLDSAVIPTSDVGYAACN